MNRLEKKSLYKNIMLDVSKIIKKNLNEAMSNNIIIKDPKDVYKLDKLSFYKKGKTISFKIDLSKVPVYDEGTIGEVYNISPNSILNIKFAYFDNYSEYYWNENKLAKLCDDEDEFEELNDNLFEFINNWLCYDLYQHLDLN